MLINSADADYTTPSSRKCHSASAAGQAIVTVESICSTGVELEDWTAGGEDAILDPFSNLREPVLGTTRQIYDAIALVEEATNLTSATGAHQHEWWPHEVPYEHPSDALARQSELLNFDSINLDS